MKKKTRIEVSIGLIMLMGITLFSQRIMAAPAPVQYVVSDKSPSKTMIPSGWSLDPKMMPYTRFTIFIKDFDMGNGAASIEGSATNIKVMKSEITADEKHLIHISSSVFDLSIPPACLVRNRLSGKTTYSGTIKLDVGHGWMGEYFITQTYDAYWQPLYGGWASASSYYFDLKVDAEVIYDVASNKMSLSFQLPGFNNVPQVPYPPFPGSTWPKTGSFPSLSYTFEFTPTVVKGPISGTNVCTAPAAGPNPNCPQFPDGICPAGLGK